MIARREGIDREIEGSIDRREGQLIATGEKRKGRLLEGDDDPEKAKGQVECSAQRRTAQQKRSST